MKLRILTFAAAALALASASAQAQTSACRADGPRCITVTFRETQMRDVAATFAEFGGIDRDGGGHRR
jgi:ABC-type proline/glycine betaine transport system substrate-binding protein